MKLNYQESLPETYVFWHMNLRFFEINKPSSVNKSLAKLTCMT